MKEAMSARIINIVGTDTDVGKTIATAAIAAARIIHGEKVAIFKPTQTGVTASMPGDAQLAAALSGAEAFEGARLRYPMAPVAAAARESKPLPGLEQHRDRVEDLLGRFDTVLVEGAGGVLVDLAEPLPASAGEYRSQNQADLILVLAALGMPTATVIVARAGLGTLNHTGLTAHYLTACGLDVTGVIIGADPAHPSPVEASNLEHLERCGLTILGAIPEGAGKGFVVGENERVLHSQKEIAAFRAQAVSWLPGLA